jgi:hypothetical protein
LLAAARAIAGAIAANTSATSVTVCGRVLWSMIGASSFRYVASPGRPAALKPAV